MLISPETITAAYGQHYERYATKAGWEIKNHVDCWYMAKRAFSMGSTEDFHKLYEELRRNWRVFRRAQDGYWSAEKLLEELNGLDQEWKEKRLSGLYLEDVAGLQRILEKMGKIKLTKQGPSVVAMSKFLHFWNPRLFLIVDSAVMWQWVLRHTWLWGEDAEEAVGKKRVDEIVKKMDRFDIACDLLSYETILLWAGRLMRMNASIASTFAGYVMRHVNSAELKELLPDLPNYEAAALEWLLMGIVELPPAGVV